MQINKLTCGCHAKDFLFDVEGQVPECAAASAFQSFLQLFGPRYYAHIPPTGKQFNLSFFSSEINSCKIIVNFSTPERCHFGPFVTPAGIPSWPQPHATQPPLKPHRIYQCTKLQKIGILGWMIKITAKIFDHT
jgi:hypothetical protein